MFTKNESSKVVCSSQHTNICFHFIKKKSKKWKHNLYCKLLRRVRTLVEVKRDELSCDVDDELSCNVDVFFCIMCLFDKLCSVISKKF